MSVPPPCLYCGGRLRTWYAFDTHVKFQCPKLRPENVEANACRDTCHLWDKDRPGVFSPDYLPPSEPVVSTCQRCGVTRTDSPDGSRRYIFPNEAVQHAVQ